MSRFTPYADDATSVSIGALTLENGTDRIALYGNLDLSRDCAGLEHARALKAILEQVIQQLQQVKDLPARIAPDETPKIVKNPF